MKRSSIGILGLLGALTLAAGAHGATPEKSISLMLALPTGDYEKSSGGGAELGGGASVGLAFPLSRGMARALTIEGLYLHNPVDVGYIESQLSGVNVEAGGWDHFGLLLGLRFKSPVTPSASLHMQAQAGFNIASFGDLTLSNGSTRVEQSSSPVFAPAFGAGAGLREGRFGLTGRFLYLGEPEFTLETRNMSNGQSAETRASQSFTLLTLAAEVHF